MVVKRRISRRNGAPRKKSRVMTTRRVAKSATSENTHRYKRMLGGNFANWPTGTLLSGCCRIAGNAVNAPWLGSYTVALSDVVNSSDFTNLYDQYRLDKLIIKFYLKFDPSSQSATTSNIPRLYWYRDLDDLTSPASLNEIRENGKCKTVPLTLYKPVTIVMKPNVLRVIYQSAVSSQYTPSFNQWLDMSTPTNQHYGLKFAIDDLTNTNYRVEVEGTLHFSCRQSR